jgi:hypothetical protein
MSTDNEVFGIRLLTNCMAPRLDRERRLAVGDDLYIELHGSPPIVRRLVRLEGADLVVVQYNPPEEQVVPIDKVRRIFKVLRNAEGFEYFEAMPMYEANDAR